MGFDSIFKSYNSRGQLIEVQYYNFKPKIPKSYRQYSYYGDITHTEIMEYNEYYDDGKLLRKFKNDLETGEKAEKVYYENGQLKEETSFKNIIVGQFESYYSNGNAKVEGKVIKNVFRLDSDRRDTIKEMDSINIISDEKIGEWKSYHHNGTIAFVCTFKLFGWTDLKQQLKFFDDMENQYPQTNVLDETVNLTKEYKPDDIINHPYNKFYTKLAGLCYSYDERGKLVKTIDFKN